MQAISCTYGHVGLAKGCSGRCFEDTAGTCSDTDPGDGFASSTHPGVLPRLLVMVLVLSACTSLITTCNLPHRCSSLLLQQVYYRRPEQVEMYANTQYGCWA